MKFYFFFFLTLLLFVQISSAQISQGGSPISFSKSFSSQIQQNIPVITMPAIDIYRLTSEDIVNDKNKDIPWRFGENIPVNIDIKINGIYDFLSNGDKLWRVRIYSPGAETINLTFDNYELPEHAKLYIYNEQKSRILGAFTNFNNQTDKIFATTLIEGESIIIEYFEPASVSFPGTLHLSRVTHGYRNVYDFTAKSFGSSGTCNNNVVCPEAAGWENQIRSSCMLVVNSSGFCSGSLLNNTANDGKPYVMTANHCSTSNNFGSWIFWFNWQSPTCSNPTTSPAHDQVTTSGCILRARNAGSDFCLVEMNQAPPSSFNVYYSGWSREEIPTPSSTCIHHPNADIKKITFANNPTISAVYNNVDSWQALWTDGATEPGSSGSPLYDENHRFIGQLYGGPSSCSASPANMNDYYGKFSVSWDGTSSSTRAKDWLDPLGTNPISIDGFDPTLPIFSIDIKPIAILAPAPTYCSIQAISPKIVIKNYGTETLTSLIIKYNIDGGGFTTQSWSGNLASFDTASITFPSISLAIGNHTFTAVSAEPNNLSDENPSNDTLSMNFSVDIGTSIPFTENFEGLLFPPSGWSVSNPDVSTTWTRNTNAGGNGSSTAAAYINLLNYSAIGQTDNLISPKINLTTVDNAQLTFKVAYRRYNSQYADELKVFISTDCGTNYSVIYHKSGSNLSTGQDLIQAFTPSLESDWRIETVDLTPYVGSSIILQFQSINHNGNNLFIDDINVVSDMPPIANFNANTTTSCTGVIEFTNLTVGIPSSILWDFGDGTTDTAINPIHTYLHDGIYTVTLFVQNPYGSNQTVQTNYININLPDLPTGSNASRCGPGDLTLSAAGSGLLYWFESANSTNPIGTGNSYNTSVLTTTTQFFVENHDEQVSNYVGNTDTTIFGGNGNFNAEYWLTFECLESIRLVSVFVNAGSSGERTIRLRDDQGNNLDSVIVNIPAGVSKIYLNFTIPPGSYQLVGPLNANLWRNNQNITFPYTIPGLISITGSNVANRYYYFYHWEVKGPDCISARLPLTAFIYPSLFSGTASITNPSICSGNSAILTLSNHQGDIQWQNSPEGISNWSDITTGNGIHDSLYISDPLYAETYYRAKIFGNGCAEVFSNSVHVNLLAGPVPGLINADNTTLCSSEIVTLTLNGSTGNIQWQQSINGNSDWTDIINETTTVYTSPQLYENIFYRAVLSFGTCPDSTTNIISIFVNPAPYAGPLAAVPEEICTGSSTNIFLDSYFGNIQWQFLNSNSLWEDISGANSQNLTTQVLTDTASFRAVLSAPECASYISDPITINVHFPPAIIISTNNSSYGLNNGTATAVVQGGTEVYTYQWDNAAANQTTQTAVDLAAGNYNVTVSDGICFNTASCSIQENPSNYPIANFSVSQQLNCTESSISFSDLTGNNPVSWSWSFPGGIPSSSTVQNPIVTYNFAGVYNVSLIATNNYGTDTIIKPNYVMITSPGSLTFNVTHESYSGASDGSATAIVSGGNPPFSYYWSNGGNSQTISSVPAGNYSVAVIDASGCFITGPISINVLTNMKETTQENHFILYPNPTSDFIYIKNNFTENCTVEISDILGKFISLDRTNLPLYSIDMRNFVNGIYYVKITTDKFTTIYKVNLTK